LLRRINSQPQKKRHDPQEQYSLKYWICCKYQLQLWKLHCRFQGMRWKDQNAQKTHSLPWEELNNTRTQKRISLHKEIRYTLWMLLDQNQNRGSCWQCHLFKSKQRQDLQNKFSWAIQEIKNWSQSSSPETKQTNACTEVTPQSISRGNWLLNYMWLKNLQLTKVFIWPCMEDSV
jgi:hypothetical protein